MNRTSQPKMSDLDWFLFFCVLIYLICILVGILFLGFAIGHIALTTWTSAPKDDHQNIATALLFIIILGSYISLCTKPVKDILSSIVGVVREAKGLESNTS